MKQKTFKYRYDIISFSIEILLITLGILDHTWLPFFFIGMWYISLFFHSAFLHRYSTHSAFAMSPRMEKIWHFLTWFFQGSSYLLVRGYAIMHREHHAHSDTKDDPHSPHFAKDVYRMMKRTKEIYSEYLKGKQPSNPDFAKNIPTWDSDVDIKKVKQIKQIFNKYRK